MEAVGEVGVGLGRGAGGEAGAVELAFEGGDAAPAGVRAREGEGGVVVGGGARRAGEDGGLGGGGVDGEGAAGGALVGVAGLVDRPDLEAVEAVGEVGVGLGRGAGGEAGAVELAFEGGDAAAAGVEAREGEGGVVVGGGARR